MVAMRMAALILAGLVAGCTLPATGPPPPRVELASGPAAERFGRSGEDVLRHPQVAPRLPGLFGADWLGAAGVSAAGTAQAASQFFGRMSVPRALLMADRPYVAVSGCLPVACRTHRGLLLVAADATDFRARLDEGGFRHYYGFGPGARMDGAVRRAVDAAWSRLEDVPSAWPSAVP